MAELVAAGAPELPDGWFYRVCSNGFCLEVQIRERRKRFGSRLHETAYVREDADDGLMAVVGACCLAMVLLEESATYRRRARSALQYVGDHDPKDRRT
ncbi:MULTISPECIES: hypothetical protein [unclassified Streptomyces]|uniref:hypothetical protein n=1 Tax=unclassified Streptomyces TaxID=2593676 RepID=UPI0033C6362D